MTPSITPSLKRIVRQYPNAYLVDFTGGTTQISKGYVSVPDVYELEEVTLSLISKMQPQSEH